MGLRRRATPAAIAALLLAAVACTDQSGEEPSAEPTAEPTQHEAPAAEEFVAGVDNPYMPLVPGTVFHYEGAGEEIRVEVTDQTREVMGVETIVVRDTVSEDGSVIEDTYDWFAQDGDGNVWYFGEDSKEIKDGEVVSTEGSWEAGVDGAQPGIIMEADPRVGDYYYQEYYVGVAEDTGAVLSVDESVDVAYGSFDGVLQTEDVNQLEPDIVEHKYFAPGVGFILEVGVKGVDERIELVSIDQP